MGSADSNTVRRLQSNLLQINPYDQDAWQQQFADSDWYHHIRSRLPVELYEIWDVSAMPGNQPTSREFHFNRYFSMSTFYYISHVLKKQPRQVIDLGCGSNLFRGLVPGLVGLDPYHPAADINDYVDDDFVRGHQAQFEAAMAINSLHFCALDDWPNRLQDFYSMLAPGGMGFVTFGLGVMIERTSDEHWLNIFNKTPDQTSISDVILWTDQVLRSLDWNLHVVDQHYFSRFNIGDVLLNNPIDGNIRIVMEKAA